MISNKYLAGVLVLVATPVFAFDVNTAHLRPTGGTVSMELAPGETCSYEMQINNFMLGYGMSNRMAYTLSSLQIASRPAHGRAGISGRSRIAYSASPTYRGSDNFRVTMTTEQAGKSEINFLVTVR